VLKNCQKRALVAISGNRFVQRLLERNVEVSQYVYREVHEPFQTMNFIAVSKRLRDRTSGRR
jgi:hypothetical protein